MSQVYKSEPEGEGYEHVGDVIVMAGAPLDAEQYKLDPRNDLVNHSPDGFAWGYGGSGPAQLALALLCDATGDDDVALRHYHTFKFAVIAKLERGAWELTADYILDWVERQKGATT